MRTTNLIIRVREFSGDTQPVFSIQSVVADSDQASEVAQKYNDIAEAEKEENLSYKCVQITI